MTLLILLVIGEGIGDYFTWEQSRSNGKTLDLMEDATTPGGEIYERGVNNTSKALCQLIDDNRQLHGIDIEEFPCDEPLPKKTETPGPLYRDAEGNCVGMSERDAERLGLVPDPTC